MLRSGNGVDATTVAPNRVEAPDAVGDDPTTMADVIQMAKEARAHCATELNDYTATFTKQEANSDGELGEETIINLKVQTRLRNESDDAPMRVYLKFVSPESNAGREVLWAEDLNDGSMAVHETAMFLNLTTIWLDPNGMVAMQGQKHPISEIGLVRLVEKLIERAEEDIDNPDVTITVSEGHEIDGIKAKLIQVRRAKPNADDEDDYSLAEVSIDPERQLILQYRSFGWPQGDGAPPLLESYTYTKIKTNVGLTDEDFNHENPAYGFP